MYLYDESKIRIVSIGEEKEGSEVMGCRASNLSIIGLFSLIFAVMPSKWIIMIRFRPQ